MNETNGSKTPHAQAREILFADSLRKAYESRVALQDLTFSLMPGRVMGFLGPNGAGKTTSIRILTTMLEPTSGHFFVDGISSEHPQEIRRKIGVLPEGLGFPKHSTGLDYLIFFGQLFGRSASDAKQKAKALLHEVGMEHRGNALIGTYSHGMRQRLGIARALVNDPAIIFLDEPTLGLDPRGQQELLGLIRRIPQERNASVVLSSHLLLEIEGICDDVVIMNSGTVVARGTVSEVISHSQQELGQRNVMRIRVPEDAVAQAQRILQGIPSIKEAKPEIEMLGWVAAEMHEPDDGSSREKRLVKNSILDALIRANIPVLSFESVGGRLQDVFLQLTAESIG